MKRPRWLVRICVMLLLGAIVNVAVAWGFSLALAPPSEPFRFGRVRGSDGASWQFTEARRCGLTALWWNPERYTAHNVGLSQSMADFASPPFWTTVSWREAPDRTLLDAGFAATIEHASGWPTRTMMRRNHVWIGVRQGAPTLDSTHRWAYAVISPVAGLANSVEEMQKEYRALPLRPIWPGFAINMAFYAVVAWLLFAVPLTLRKRWRIKRGLCLKCAYDLRGGAVDSIACPECGATK